MNKKRQTNSELVATSKNRKEQGWVLIVSKDGWVVTDKGVMGDNVEDCTIFWENQINYLKNLRKEKKLSQQEMGWILGISRYAYIYREQGKSELTHKEWLITRIINENF